jgi:hypothetical protein
MGGFTSGFLEETWVNEGSMGEGLERGAYQGLIGGATGMVGGALGAASGGLMGNTSRSLFRTVAVGTASGALMGGATGGTMNALNGGSFWEGAGRGAMFGGIGGGLSSALMYSSVLGNDFIEVSRWGRAGLKPGDWVMKGRVSGSNYIRSGKWQRGHGNQFAKFDTGRPYIRSRSTLQSPSANPSAHFTDKGIFGFIKYVLGQRTYLP